ncbi:MULTISPECIES: hypothetical protein [Actinokineospora]|uniref:Uncharacterized protein n=1 Tax=Actinokineospora fastidiosa TaxID=1816 RepID=A0A918G0R4_9PSEU|nr:MULTISPECIES: hypothetical protein [Actinokineospora]UVS77239.1 hypothetical protein Actkin_00941 [Actinokineospora sp. UTMC 2448]GGS12523.1 hypothetical protein GCM10010171_00200 [Actinokineospora fastidiosa]
MPIRTNRGRAAVYRKLWGWPLRSPRHLAVAAFVAALLITAAGILIPKLAGTDTPRASGTSTQTSETKVFGSRTVVVPPGAGGTATATETRVEPTLTPSSAPPAPEALGVAKEWATAFVTHPEGISPETWREQLRPFTDVEYMVALDSVDPRNVFATAVTGEPRVVVSYDKSVVIDVPTDKAVLRLTLIETEQGWRVSDYTEGEG